MYTFFGGALVWLVAAGCLGFLLKRFSFQHHSHRALRIVCLIPLLGVLCLQGNTIAHANPTNTPGVTYYEWSQQQRGSTLMISVDEGFCVLQAVTGKFQGPGEAIRIEKTAIQGNPRAYWSLGGWSNQKDLAASARCIPYSAIQGADQGIQVLHGKYAEADMKNSDYFWANASYPLWTRDSFCYISGMSGKFMGIGERIDIVPYDPKLPETPHYVSVSTQQTYIRGEATCIALPGRERLHTTETDALDHRWPLVYSWQQGEPPKLLPNANDAFCGLWGIHGKFMGKGEVVGIYVGDDGSQILAGGSKQIDVGAYAACFYYDQRQ